MKTMESAANTMLDEELKVGVHGEVRHLNIDP